MTQVAIGNQTVETQAEVAENWGTSALIEDAIRHGEGLLAKDGPLVVETGKHTGRSAKDKFIVQDDETAGTIWWGKTNVPMTPDHFAALKADFFAALADKDKLYVADLFGGICDIRATAYTPKPDPVAYATMITHLGIDPARSLFVEDMARNLTPAKALGMTTVWLDNGSESGHRDHLPDQVDFHVSDLADWLDSLPAPWGIS